MLADIAWKFSGNFNFHLDCSIFWKGLFCFSKCSKNSKKDAGPKKDAGGEPGTINKFINDCSFHNECCRRAPAAWQMYIISGCSPLPQSSCLVCSSIFSLIDVRVTGQPLYVAQYVHSLSSPGFVAHLSVCVSVTCERKAELREFSNSTPTAIHVLCSN